MVAVTSGSNGTTDHETTLGNLRQPWSIRQRISVWVNFGSSQRTVNLIKQVNTEAGTGYVLVRLRDFIRKDMVSNIAEKWTKLARTGAIGITFMGFDITTVMFSLENAQNTYEVKEFVLTQPESYEIKMGDRFFKRPGDPPYDGLLKELHKGKKKRSTSSNDAILKTEL